VNGVPGPVVAIADCRQEAGEGLASIDGIEKEAFCPGHQTNGFEHGLGRHAVSLVKLIARTVNRCQVDRRFLVEQGKCRARQIMSGGASRRPEQAQQRT
jgi:hypothetical protein